MKNVVLKRIYDEYEQTDGYRILVDRLWPRGIKKEKAHIDLWLKEIAPTNELRKWYGHRVERWEEFKINYQSELETNTIAVEQLKSAIKNHKKITLLFGARDIVHNQATILYEWCCRVSC